MVSHEILRRRKTPCDLPICSVPLKTYNRQFFNGFLASGGSLYLIWTPLTRFVSLASNPEFPKFGFSGSLAGGSSPYIIQHKTSDRSEGSTYILSRFLLDSILVSLSIIIPLLLPIFLTILSSPTPTIVTPTIPSSIPIAIGTSIVPPGLPVFARVIAWRAHSS